jgi:hypothetical protein
MIDFGRQEAYLAPVRRCKRINASPAPRILRWQPDLIRRASAADSSIVHESRAVGPLAAKENQAMPDNRISATLSTEDQTAVMDAINTIRRKLNFLIDLTPDERHTLPKMGDKSRAFVSQALTLAQQNADILPRSFDLEEMQRDVALTTALEPIRAVLTQLQELVEDTYMAAGSEAYAASLLLYQYAKASGKGAALDNLLDGLGKRFARKSSGKTSPSGDPNPEPKQ